MRDANGQPLYSGRVLLLPFMEQKPLYDQWDQKQAWDSPRNLPLSQNLLVFTDPSAADRRQGGPIFLFVVGKGTAFDERPEGAQFGGIDGRHGEYAVYGRGAGIREFSGRSRATWISASRCRLAAGESSRYHAGGVFRRERDGDQNNTAAGGRSGDGLTEGRLNRKAVRNHA